MLLEDLEDLGVDGLHSLGMTKIEAKKLLRKVRNAARKLAKAWRSVAPRPTIRPTSVPTCSARNMGTQVCRLFLCWPLEAPPPAGEGTDVAFAHSSNQVTLLCALGL